MNLFSRKWVMFTCKALMIWSLTGLISNTAEGIVTKEKHYKCHGRNITFRCEAVKRVPPEFYIGTIYQIEDLKNTPGSKKTEIYCRGDSSCTIKNDLDGRIQVLEINSTRMVLQMLRLDDSLTISCQADTEAGYLSTQHHASNITTVECVSSCMGQEVLLSCQKFRHFLQNPVGQEAFLKRLGTSEDIVFCGNNRSCVCINGCGVYSGRLTPGYRSVKLVEVQKEDAKVEFMFHFQDLIGHQASRTCVFKIYPEICPDPSTNSPVATVVKSLQESDSRISTKEPEVHSTTGTTNLAGMTKGTKFYALVMILTNYVFSGTCV